MKLKASLALYLFLTGAPLWAANDPDIYHRTNALLDAWEIPKAEQALQSLAHQFPNEKESAFLRARLEFMKGFYQKAWNLVENVSARNPYWIDFKMLLNQTRKTTALFVTQESEHFRFYFIDGPDEILLHYAMEALESSYRVLGKIFDYYPSEKVRVEFYPSRKPFSQISPLTLKDILTSGTVALCKYNRIMAISPGSLFRGYNWMDTLSHEYIHYLLTKKSKNTVPLWLHEGLAKYFENRWRNISDPLTPMMETALARGLAEDHFIGLDDMMPSFAKLKTAEDVQLAYAEVSSMVDYMISLHGEAVVPQLIEKLSAGNTIKNTMQQIFEHNLPEFQRAWEVYAKQKDFKEIPGLKTLQFRFKNDRKREKGNNRDDYESIGSKKARDYTFLGDILKSHNHLDAAVIEYKKAMLQNDILSPILYNKLALTLMTIQKYDQAEPLLHKSLKYYPMFHTTLTHLGELYYQFKKWDKAAVFYERAIRTNPFNPLVHMRLINLYDKLGRMEDHETQTQLFQLLE